MLISQSPAVGDIVTLKLVSGEEIVGKLTERHIDSVVLSKPVQITMQPVGQGQVGLVFMPVLGSASEASAMQFPFSGLAIRPVKTGDDVQRNYTKATTGILTPSAQDTAILTA